MSIPGQSADLLPALYDPIAVDRGLEAVLDGLDAMLNGRLLPGWVTGCSLPIGLSTRRHSSADAGVILFGITISLPTLSQVQVSCIFVAVSITRPTKDAASRELTARWAGDHSRCSAAMPTSNYFRQEATDLRYERYIKRTR